jgi:hypothetical protein
MVYPVVISQLNQTPFYIQTQFNGPTAFQNFAYPAGANFIRPLLHHSQPMHDFRPFDA